MHISSKNLWYYVLPAALLLGTLFYAGMELWQEKRINEYTPFEPLYSLTIGGERFFVSIADSDSERQLGLSHTKLIPPDVLKLFVFDSSDTWSFWMKDMKYSIDIWWLDEFGKVVHIERAVSPDTYPAKFRSPVNAKYVIESRSGFCDDKGIIIGSKVDIDSVLSQQR